MDALLGLLEHPHLWIRWNAAKALRERTGQRFGRDGGPFLRDAATGFARDGEDRAAASLARTWRRWLEGGGGGRHPGRGIPQR